MTLDVIVFESFCGWDVSDAGILAMRAFLRCGYRFRRLCKFIYVLGQYIIRNFIILFKKCHFTYRSGSRGSCWCRCRGWVGGYGDCAMRDVVFRTRTRRLASIDFLRLTYIHIIKNRLRGGGITCGAPVLALAVEDALRQFRGCRRCRVPVRPGIRYPCAAVRFRLLLLQGKTIFALDIAFLLGVN
jgi:hypothetical protein